VCRDVRNQKPQIIRYAERRPFEIQPLISSERAQTTRRFSILGLGWERTPAGRALTIRWWKIPLGGEKLSADH
jgi:hypothetical protein